jgi:hypothetical protein
MYLLAAGECAPWKFSEALLGLEINPGLCLVDVKNTAA